MNEFLTSVKADLLDRRIVPLVALVVVGLLAAVGYAVLGGSSTPATPTASAPSPQPSSANAGIAVSQKTTSKAVAETTNGSTDQRKGNARNPFAPLPGAVKAAVAAKASSGTLASGAGTSTSTSSSKTGSGSSSPTPSAPTPTPATPSKPVTPAKPQPVYHVAVLFGPHPAEAPAEAIQLTPYENLKLLTPLPSATQPLVVFRGVTVGGKSATFTVVGEVILHGSAACLPSDSQCQAIDLQPGQSEQLEYISSSGQTIAYELRVVTISSSNASSASVKNVLRSESKAGRELLRRDGLTAVPDLRYSGEVGVLVFAGHRAFGARAARRHHHS